MIGQAQRRLAAILAADVVGYSRLVRADEEGTISALKALRSELVAPKVADHNGRIVKLMGDGLLAEFPSVVDAVRAAVEMQRAVVDRKLGVLEDKRIAFRIGVNVGDVMVDGDDIYGDGVNVAARLEGLADPGGIWISGSAFEQVRDKLSVGFEDMGERQVKNIDRPVRVFRVLDVPSAPIPSIGWFKSSVKRWTSTVTVAALAGLIVVAGLVSWWRPWAHPPEPPAIEATRAQLGVMPTIAVLPFDSPGDATPDYFSRGITEDIITALGRYRTLGVMSYNAALPYKGQESDPAHVGQALGVRYLLEGSVRRADERVRVGAHLTDADKGTVLWSEQFDEEDKDVFAIQDAITRKIAGMLAANLTRVEQERAFKKPTENLSAYDLVLRGRERLSRPQRRSNREARELFEQAVALDPDYADAYAWLGRAYYEMVSNGWTEFPARTLDRVEEFAQKALSIDPDTIEAFRILGRTHALQFQLDRAITEIDQAVTLNPSDALANGDRGLILLWASRPDEAVAALETAFTYDPNLGAEYYFTQGLAYYLLHRHEDAIRVLEQGATRYPDYVFIAAALVAAYGQLDRSDDALRNVEKVKRLLPIFDAATFGSRLPDPEHREYLLDGLRKGGLG
jgi:adenylate cyclase